MTAQSTTHVPPPVIAGCHVHHYAVRPRSVRQARRTLLFVDDVELGGVPRLAIGRELGQRDLTILHCNARWSVLGASGGFKSVREAKGRIERIYPGLAPHWTRTDTTLRQARAYWRSLGPECSACRRAWYEVDRMVGVRAVHLCERCIRRFDALLDDPAV